MPEVEFHTVASTADIEPKGMLCVQLREREILICHTGESYFAVDNTCTHAAACLSDGRLKGHRLLCPLHGAAFDVRNGEALKRPATQGLKCYPLRIDGYDIAVGISTDEHC